MTELTPEQRKKLATDLVEMLTAMLDGVVVLKGKKATKVSLKMLDSIFAEFKKQGRSIKIKEGEHLHFGKRE